MNCIVSYSYVCMYVCMFVWMDRWVVDVCMYVRICTCDCNITPGICYQVTNIPQRTLPDYNPSTAQRTVLRRDDWREKDAGERRREKEKERAYDSA